MSKPDKILVRMARIVQMILRNKIETAASLAHKLGVSLRTLGVDIALLKKIHAIDRIGPDNGGEWIVQLKWWEEGNEGLWKSEMDKSKPNKTISECVVC